MTQFFWREFTDLNASDLYAVLALRNRAFVVEYGNAYQDIDGLDPHARHLLGIGRGGTLDAYARILPPQPTDSAARLTRVAVRPEVRRGGLGRRMVAEALVEIERQHGPVAVRLSARSHLIGLYEDFGFRLLAPRPTDFSAVPRVPMERPADISA